jgi:hypothetical protein
MLLIAKEKFLILFQCFSEIFGKWDESKEKEVFFKLFN